MIEFLIYGAVALICIWIISIYIKKLKKESKQSEIKIEKAIEEGIHEPVSLYPYIDTNTCIKSGACISACPEEDIIGIRNGRATLINASRCVGHGACFHACPVEAISLRIGTEKRGVDLPHVNQNFETNVRGIFIAGELGGMGLIKNSVEQGKQAVDNLAMNLTKDHKCEYDLVIIGAGPAGIAASLQAKKYGLRVIALEQDSLGGTVFNFPRSKIIMTSPMDLPGYGKIKLFNTSKTELLKIWMDVIDKNGIVIKEHCKVEKIEQHRTGFEISTLDDQTFTTDKVLLAIGRRGTPRKLTVDGEGLEKVTYRLLEPELIIGKNVLIVGGGDSAIESALLLAANNDVTLSYRSEQFSRLKPRNNTAIKQALEDCTIKVLFNSNVRKINENEVEIEDGEGRMIRLKNDLVYIFAGGELPTQFLQKSGIEISRRFNYTLKSHKK